MASHSEIVLMDAADLPAPSKSRKTRGHSASAPKRAKHPSSREASGPAEEITPVGSGADPVIKLRDINIVDDAKPGKTKQNNSPAGDHVGPLNFRTPPPTGTSDLSSEKANASGSFNIPAGINGEHPVSDPELLELLEQLSVTIDSANTVLDAASTLPAEGKDAVGETVEMSGQKPLPVPGPTPEPVPVPRPYTEDLPPLATRLAPKSPPAPTPRKSGIGFGLVANTSLTGLVFAAGVGWLLYTNPWLLKGNTDAPGSPEISSARPDAKDQASLLQTERSPVKRSAVEPARELSAFTPPGDDPAPMENVTQPATLPAASLAPASGPAGQPIALNISIPSIPGRSEMSVMIQGVPATAKLSAGKDIGSGNWLLNTQQLEGMTVTTDAGFKPGKFDLDVILVRSDGTVPKTRKVPVTVEPVAAAMAAQPATGQPDAKVNTRAAASTVTASVATTFAKPGVAINVPAASVSPAPIPVKSRLDPQDVKMLLTRGETLLGEGDVAGARLLLEYAANNGSKQAMVKMGNSYDPKYLSNLGVLGVQPDEATAVLWYDRASKAAVR